MASKRISTDMNAVFHRTHAVPVLALVVLAGTGCRTYGGYGSEEATLAQIEAANERFAEALRRAEAEAAMLSEALADVKAVAPYVDAYRWVTQRHAEMLETHRAKYETLQQGASYRELSRALGAIVTEQIVVQEQYEHLLWAMAYAESMPALTVRLLSSYQAIPPYYVRIEERLQTPTAEDVVARYRSATAL
ncbi:MAG: hypothetical protein D6746_12625 [Bacteroidetes bacterium]|nr:MAG: hypothetical protein D6746_12625 [Bacteroidota bacterium]